MQSVLFIFKKIVSRLLFPVGLVLALWALGGILWLRRPASLWGPGLMLGAGILLLTLSMPLVGSALLSPLERAAGDYASPAGLAQMGVRRVAVLAGAHRQGDLSLANRLGAGTLMRVMEGVRIWKGLPGAKLIMLGGDFEGDEEPAVDMAAMARELGVPDEALVVEKGSWDTGDQAEYLARTLGREPFALVTSAHHMPRSLYLCRRAGLNPLAAPALFRSRDTNRSIQSWLPSAAGLNMSELAVYEYLGLAWARLAGPKEAGKGEGS